MKKILLGIGTIAALALFLPGCGDSRWDSVQRDAPNVFETQGFGAYVYSYTQEGNTITLLDYVQIRASGKLVRNTTPATFSGTWRLIPTQEYLLN